MKTNCLESCKKIALSGAGPPDGTFGTTVDYRGRPDFYREDDQYNLFGENHEDNTSCYWRIDSVEFEFPYYTVDDCSNHPVDIGAAWRINKLDLAPENVAIEILCADVKESNPKLTLYLTSSLCSLLVVLLLVWGHILIRKRRLQKAKRECPVCRKSARDAARVVQAAFRKNSLKTLT